MEDLARRVADHGQWYHTLELAPGVVTPGWYDLRALPSRLPLPPRLDGLRCLDVGTFDGFWAFELERRGAREVMAVDVLDPRQWDWPAGSSPDTVQAIGERKQRGAGFELAHAALGSAVRRLERSVYDLDPAELGTFDLVYVGSLLLHLRDPVRAIQRVAAVCAGRALFVDAIDLALSRLAPRLPLAGLEGRGRPWWWLPNLAGLERMLEAGGFVSVAPARVARMPAGAGQPRGRIRPRALADRGARRALLAARRGEPHAAALVRPA